MWQFLLLLSSSFYPLPLLLLLRFAPRTSLAVAAELLAPVFFLPSHLGILLLISSSASPYPSFPVTFPGNRSSSSSPSFLHSIDLLAVYILSLSLSIPCYCAQLSLSILQSSFLISPWSLLCTVFSFFVSCYRQSCPNRNFFACVITSNYFSICLFSSGILTLFTSLTYFMYCLLAMYLKLSLGLKIEFAELFQTRANTLTYTVQTLVIINVCKGS